MDRTAALQQIKPRIEEYLQGKGIDTRRNFKCFNAENHQHGDGKPSMSLDRVNHQAHCFTISCGARYDIIDLISSTEQSEKGRGTGSESSGAKSQARKKGYCYMSKRILLHEQKDTVT